MHLTDVIGYHYGGAAICTDCFTSHPIDNEAMEAHGGAVSAENEHEFSS